MSYLTSIFKNIATRHFVNEIKYKVLNQKKLNIEISEYLKFLIFKVC